MKVLTLIGKQLAKPGTEFVYLGLPKECESCRLRSSCDNLEPGLRYKVLSVKSESLQECLLHYSGVVLVEVGIANLQAAVPCDSIRGSLLRFKPQDCDNFGCDYYQYCVPAGGIPGKEYQLIKLGKSIHCPRSRELKLVELRYRMEEQ